MLNKLLVCSFVIPIASFSQVVGFRQYKLGEVSRYKLTSEVYRNNKFASKTISLSEHRVVIDIGFLSEEIRWVSKISLSNKDTIKFDSVAQSIKPYNISLSPEGKVLLPKLTTPEMVGDITDLNTFFVAVAPALNVQKLTSGKQIFTNGELRHGNFADSIVILYGVDCIEVTQSLLKTTKQHTIVKTEFTPPSSVCLSPLFDTTSARTFDRPDNFQMIQKGSGDKVNVFSGIESFTIITKVDKVNGQIVEATMTNLLNLRMRYNSSQDLKTYEREMPMTIKRNVRLELLSE